MFDGNIDNISNTKIFTSIVYPSKLEVKKINGIEKGFKIPVGKPLQLVVYTTDIKISPNFIDMDVPGIKVNSNTLILPFPLINGENRVKILNMSDYTNFFDDVDMIFPSTITTGFQGFITDLKDDMVETNYVGGYKTLIVPNYEKLCLLKHKHFELSANIKELIGKYYPKKYGFILCAFDKSIQMKPIAYVHEIREDNRLFIPARYYHKKNNPNAFSKYKDDIDEKTNKRDETDLVSDYIYGTLMIDDQWMHLTSKKRDLQSYREKSEIVWNHEIYIVNFSRLLKNPLLKKPGIRIINGDLDRLVNFYTYVESSKMPKEIVLTKPTSLYKIKIDNNYKYNYDFYL